MKVSMPKIVENDEDKINIDFISLPDNVHIH